MSRPAIEEVIDALGHIKARIAALENEADQYKAMIVKRGPGAYEGKLFRATVSATTRETLNMAAVREKLSPQFIRANTVSTPVVSVRVVARNGEGV